MTITVQPIMSTGTTLSVDTSGSPTGTATYVVVGGFKTISGLGSGSASIVDVTSLTDSAHVKLKGLQDGGSVKLSFHYMSGDVGQAALHANQGVPTAIRLQLTLPTPAGATKGDVFTFAGLVQNWEPGVGVDQEITLSVTVEVTGLVTLAAAA